jgi:hypothetical protein
LSWYPPTHYLLHRTFIMDPEPFFDQLCPLCRDLFNNESLFNITDEKDNVTDEEDNGTDEDHLTDEEDKITDERMIFSHMKMRILKMSMKFSHTGTTILSLGSFPMYNQMSVLTTTFMTYSWQPSMVVIFVVCYMALCLPSMLER